MSSPTDRSSSFPPARRLRRAGEYQKVREKGNKRHTTHFLVVALAPTSGSTRLGLTVSRKIGNAVRRNRVKRLLREFFRRHYSELPPRTDLSIVAKRGAAELDYPAVAGELAFLLRGEDARPRS